MTFSPTRPELYGPVHKGLRWAGTHALVTVGACAGDAASTARALDAVRDLLVLHEIHQRVEDAVVIPAIEARRPGAGRRLIDAHVDHTLGIADLRARVRRLAAGTPSLDELRALYLELSRFIAEDMLHMHEEETIAEPLLREIYSDAELEALHGRVLGQLAPDERAAFGVVMSAAAAA